MTIKLDFGDSMTESPCPTWAEATNVANAVRDVAMSCSAQPQNYRWSLFRNCSPKPYGQNLCFSRSLQEKDGNAINVYEPFEEFGLVGSLDSRQKMHQGITDFGPDQRKKHSK